MAALVVLGSLFEGGPALEANPVWNRLALQVLAAEVGGFVAVEGQVAFGPGAGLRLLTRETFGVQFDGARLRGAGSSRIGVEVLRLEELVFGTSRGAVCVPVLPLEAFPPFCDSTSGRVGLSGTALEVDWRGPERPARLRFLDVAAKVALLGPAHGPDWVRRRLAPFVGLGGELADGVRLRGNVGVSALFRFDDDRLELTMKGQWRPVLGEFGDWQARGLVRLGWRPAIAAASDGSLGLFLEAALTHARRPERAVGTEFSWSAESAAWFSLGVETVWGPVL